MIGFEPFADGSAGNISCLVPELKLGETVSEGLGLNIQASIAVPKRNNKTNTIITKIRNTM